MSTENNRAASGRVPPPPAERRSVTCGPLPLDWLVTAAQLPGRSLHAGVALWYAAGLTQSSSVSFSNTSSLLFGLDRNAKYRALGWLERAGLIAVERKLGRAPLITILTRDSKP